ncbi:MAG: CoA-binding protein [Candidatus Helarchaeota archaeon]
MNNWKLITKNTNFDSLFFPKNITIVGASPSYLYGSGFFIEALSAIGFPPDKLFLINPKHAGKKINGFRFYESLTAIEEVELDIIISSIRANLVPNLIREAVEKRVKFVVVFTSGFSELLTEKGIELNKTILEIIKGSSTRIIGPNCLGPHCPKGKVTYNNKALKQSGNISFAAQSGGHAIALLENQKRRCLFFSKGISFGNQIDVNCIEILDYYSNDPDTEVIGMYLESTGSADTSEFFQKVHTISSKKPVIIWKGGQSDDGVRMTASHTGALSGSLELWKSATKQVGAVFVENSTEFWDMLHLFSIIMITKKFPTGNRVGGVIPGGGNSVELTDIFTNAEFSVPEISVAAQNNAAKLFPGVNTSFRNPLDIGPSVANVDLVLKSIKILEEEENIDIILFYIPTHWLAAYEKVIKKGYAVSLAQDLGQLNRKLSKLLIVICPLFTMKEFDLQITQKFREELYKMHIPFFLSSKDAAIGIRKLRDYTQQHNVK